MLFSSGLYGQSSIVDSIIAGSVNSRPFFQFLIKKNGSIFYNYDSSDLDRSLIAIGKPTKMKLVEVLNTVEKKYQLKLTEDDIIIRADAEVVYKQFKLVKEALKEKQLFKFRIITIAEPGKDSPVNVKKEVENNVILVSQKTLVIILAANDVIFYQHGNNCKQLSKTNFKHIKEVLQEEKKNTPVKDLFIIIKATTGSTFKNAVDLLDELVLNNIPAKHYAEIDITAEDINCIENYKKQ